MAPVVPPLATLAEVDRLARFFQVTRMSVLIGVGCGEIAGMLLNLSYDREGLRSRLHALSPCGDLADGLFETSLRYSTLERRWVLGLRRGAVTIVMRLRPRAVAADAPAFGGARLDA